MNLVPDQLTLDNSAQEPIHISGWIQCHGVLLAFDRFGVLIKRSSNAMAVLNPGVAVAWRLAGKAHFADDAGLHDLMAQVPDAPDDDEFGYAAEIHGAYGAFHMVAHRNARGLICEFESGLAAVPKTVRFSFSAHRAMERLRRLGTVDELLGAAVQEVRRLTG